MLPKLAQKLGKRSVAALYVASAVLLVGGASLWWFKVSTAPERVFWDAVSQGLSTSSVVIDSEQTSSGSSLHQTVQFTLGATNMSHTLTTVKQGSTTVVNEMIGTPTTDYTRYLDVKTDQTAKNGKPLDFSKVLGYWAKGDAGSNQLFSQSVLGVGLPLGGVAMPIGNLQSDERAKLIKQMKSDVVYQIDYKKVERKRDHGRLVYVYDVSVQAVAYANLMQRFAQKMGLHDLDGLNPGDFQGQAATEMRLTVDVRARHLIDAEVSANGAHQTYGSYDVVSPFTLPKKTITVTELQDRLSHLQ